MIYKKESYDIIGAAMEVHRVMGNGFTEYVYQDALAIELKKRKIPYEKEKLINVFYKDEVLDHYYKADFVCYGDIIVELKAVTELTDAHVSQLLNYLHATGKKLGILINFGEESLVYKRVVLEK